MARMSLPQMEDAFICTSTCPCCGFGMGNSANSTVLFPGRIAPRIIPSLRCHVMWTSWSSSARR